jgi:hypothetical protein
MAIENVTAPKVKMRTPSLTFHAFLVEFAETLVSKISNNQHETCLTMDHPFQKLAWCQAEHKDKRSWANCRNEPNAAIFHSPFQTLPNSMKFQGR